MQLYSRSMIVFGMFCLVMFLAFPLLFIEYWKEERLYWFVSCGVVFFLILFGVVYRSIYQADALQQARVRYQKHIGFLDVLPNTLFIWQLSIWMIVFELVTTGVFISYMNGVAFLMVYPLWMVGAGVVFSVSGFLASSELKKAGTYLFGMAVVDMAALMLYLQVIPFDLNMAHYIQMVLAACALGLYPIWLGVRHARR